MNKEVAENFHEVVLNNGRYDEAKRYVSNEVVFRLNQNDPLLGIKEFESHMSPIQIAFPDLTYVTEDIIEEGDTIALYWISTGTHKASLGEISATGRKITLKGLSLFRLEGGKIKENIVFFNESEIPKQLGVL
ncbi:ester cyclase [Gracilibacillus sp. YIM 98692]|uniref:ester cyclase n=1 Tax=Gracilibacillus sp. YIM 98692 TaxID=2663532 RepID=UPI0013D101F7|nr:ester cyclase [Gracilibacillus sp. YIM 98692]